MTQAYPLHWPVGRARTKLPERSRFAISFGRAVKAVLEELRLTGCKPGTIVISTNVPLKQNGLPYADHKPPADAGVAVYFMSNDGRQMCVSCDRWDKVEDNLQAVRKTLEALRGIERWGSKAMANSAYTGFQAIKPPDASRPWWEVLKCQPNTRADFVEENYRRLSRENHPDRGGDERIMQEINDAFEAFKKERG